MSEKPASEQIDGIIRQADDWRGAKLADPERLFNTRLDSKTVRAIDVAAGEEVSAAGLRDLVREAIEGNTGKI